MIAILTMYRLAVDFNDSRCLGGIVKPENMDSSYGSIGTYYNFAEMPSNIWKDVEKNKRIYSKTLVGFLVLLPTLLLTARNNLLHLALFCQDAS